MTHRQSSWIPAWGWVAAALLLVFTLYTTWHARRIRIELAEKQVTIDQLNARNRQLLFERAKMRRIQTVLSDSATRQVTLHPSNSSSGFSVMRAYWNLEHGVVLFGEGIPALSNGETYQLWMVPEKTRPHSVGTFQPAADGALLEIFLLKMTPDAGATFSLRRDDELIITEEPDGGAAQPSREPIWAGKTR